jgi:hypothetical protein
MPTQHKATKTSAKSIQIRTPICFESNLAYMDHPLPPLGLFLQINLKFLSLSQKHLLRHNKSCSKRIDQRFQKLPLFPIIKPSPHKRPTFDNKRQTRVFWQTKNSNSTISKFSSGSWSIYCFGLIFSPFGNKHQNGINFGPLTPLPHQKSSTKRKGNKSTKMNLEEVTRSSECSGSLAWSKFTFSLSILLWD